MDNNKTDLELVAEVRNGHEESFEILTNRYAKKVYNMALHLVKSEEDAEEVLQDVFVTLYRKITTFEGKSSFSSWLYRVAVNAALMKVRKNIQKDNDTLGKDLSIQRSDELLGDDLASQGEFLNELKNALAVLPDSYRKVFVMRDISGFTNREVSECLKITIPTVKSRLHRSRFILREKLAGLYREYFTNTKNDDFFDSEGINEPVVSKLA